MLCVRPLGVVGLAKHELYSLCMHTGLYCMFWMFQHFAAACVLAQASQGLGQLNHFCTVGPVVPCRLSCERFGHKRCLGRRPIVNGIAGPYQFCTFSEAAEQSTQVASACAQLGLQRCDRIGVLGLNSPEWMLAMQV